MDQKKRPSLRGLIANRNKGATSIEVPRVQVSTNLPFPPPFPTDLGLRINSDLKKKRPMQELEEREVLPQRGTKQQKTKDPRDKRAKSIDSRDDTEVHRQRCTWALVIEMDEAPIPYDSTIRESSRGHATHLAQALEQPLLLPKDMEALKRTRQPDLFMSLKRDLAMVSELLAIPQFIALFHSYIYFFYVTLLLLLCRSLNKSMWLRSGFEMPIINLKLSPTLDVRLRKRSGP